MAQQLQLPKGISEKRLKSVYDILKEQPITTADIAERLEVSPDIILPCINYLKDAELIEPISRTYYYRLVDYKYPLFTDNPRKLYEPMFQTLPLIKDWYDLTRNNQWQRQLIKDFYRICTGRVVESFAKMPERWDFPRTPMEFLDRYREQYDSHPPKNITKAVSTFLILCLAMPKERVPLLQMHYNNGQDGQYRFIKLSEGELQKAKDWLKTEGMKLAKEPMQKEELPILLFN